MGIVAPKAGMENIILISLPTPFKIYFKFKLFIHKKGVIIISKQTWVIINKLNKNVIILLIKDIKKIINGE